MCHNSATILVEGLCSTHQVAAEAVLEALEAGSQPRYRHRGDVAAALGDLVGRAPRGQGWSLDVTEHATVVGGRRGGGTTLMAGVALAEGRTFVLRASAAGVRLAAPDQNRRERAAERERQRMSKRADLTAVVASADLPARTGVVTEWSRKSRARMAETVAGLDYRPLLRPGTTAGMVTATYPGRWQEVAPTGAATKHHVDVFRRRWARAFGWSPPGLWKLEFQRRGAPHLHFYLPVPARAPAVGCAHLGPLPRGQRREVLCDCDTFERWLSRTWADVVDADATCDLCGGDTRDGCCAASAERRGATSEYGRHLAAGTGVDFAAVNGFTDPRRIAIYFSKHSSKTGDGKEYQHVVPVEWQEPGAGPGRFWGYWGLERTDVLVHVELDEYVAARRVLRRVMKARAWRVEQQRQASQLRRSGAATARPPRTVRTLGARGGLDGGFVLVNDGVRLVADLARFLLSRSRGGPPCP